MVNQELTENPVLEEQGPEPDSIDGEAGEGQERDESEETAAKES